MKRTTRGLILTATGIMGGFSLLIMVMVYGWGENNIPLWAEVASSIGLGIALVLIGWGIFTLELKDKGS